MKWKRRIWWVLIAACIGAGLFYGFRPQPAQVEVSRVALGPMQLTVEEEGKTRLRNRYVVSAPVAGFARRLRWKVGDAVSAGEAVAVLEPMRPVVLDPRTREQSEARVRAAEAAVAAVESRVRAAEEQIRAAQADQSYWRGQLQRDESLHKSGDLPAERIEKTRTELRRVDAAVSGAEFAAKAVRADVENARAELAAARAALANSSPGVRGGAGELVTVTAPVAGRVVRVIHESEGVVTPGQPLVELGNARALEVEVELLSADAVRVGPGTRVILTRWGGERPIEARVRTVEPAGFTKVSALGVEEQRVRVISDIVSPEQEWQRLGDGYRVDASFVLWEGAKVLHVPASALFRLDSGWAVFVAADGFARRKPVEVGHRNGLSAEVLKGLEEGELVVTHPDDSVTDGREVAVK